MLSVTWSLPSAAAIGQYAFAGFIGSQGRAVDQYGGPSSIAVDSAGNVYVADGNRILKYSGKGVFIKSVGEGVPSDRIVVDRADNVYVSGYVANAAYVITSFTPEGKMTSEFQPLEPTDSTCARHEEFEIVGVDSSGRIHLIFSCSDKTDYGPVLVKVQVQRYWSNGTFAGGLDVMRTMTDVVKEVPCPCNGALDSTGNIFLADNQNSLVAKISPDGKLLKAWGGRGKGTGQFSFAGIPSVKVDGQDNVYIADRLTPRVQKFTNDGVFLLEIAPATGEEGRLSYPVDVAIDGSGNVYVLNLIYGDTRIFKFSPTSTFDFRISAHNQTVRLRAGEATDVKIRVETMSDLKLEISLQTDVIPKGISAFISNGAGRSSFDSTVHLYALPNSTAGKYNFIFVARGGQVSRALPLTVEVVAPSQQSLESRGAIPGFPWQSILVGFLLAAVSIAVIRKKRLAARTFQKSGDLKRALQSS